MNNRQSHSFSAFILLLILLACTAIPAIAENVTAPAANIPACPRYDQDSSWASRPAKAEKPVDVFYVYPTIYPDPAPLNMDIKRKDLQARIQGLLTAQAGVYSTTANLYAPYYRQMSFAALNAEEDMYFNPNFRIGTSDVDRAFEYYLARLNPDRPFILAGHSQGAMVLIDLMRRRFWDPNLRKRLVAAYLIGYSVTDKELETYPWLKIAQKAEDTGVIITYNTQSATASGSPVLLPGAKCTNPLNWTTGPQPADKSLNKGAVFFNDFNGTIKREVPGYVGAKIDAQSGALIVEAPEKLELGNFPAGVYHKFDYAFFYRNLQENVKQRCEAYLKKHQ